MNNCFALMRRLAVRRDVRFWGVMIFRSTTEIGAQTRR